MTVFANQASVALPQTPPQAIAVELTFGLTGKTLAIDHGYELYSALCRWQPLLHELTGIAVQTITGTYISNSEVLLNQASRLRIRLPIDQVPLLGRLLGKSLIVGNHKIRLGVPQIYELRPEPELYARMVTIRNFQEPESFLLAAQRQLQQLDVEGKLSITRRDNGELRRKTLRIKHHTIVGFGVEVTGLSDEDSLKLQTHGIGGRRKLGAGIFLRKNHGSSHSDH